MQQRGTRCSFCQRRVYEDRWNSIYDGEGRWFHEECEIAWLDKQADLALKKALGVIIKRKRRKA